MVQGERGALMFKPVTGGYVFTAPGAFPFSLARYYLVSEEEKARLIAAVPPYRLAWQLVTLSIAVVLAMVAGRLLFGWPSSSSGTLATTILIGLTCGIGVTVWNLFRLRGLRAILPTLRQTEQTLGLSERFTGSLSSFSRKQLLAFTILSCVLLAGGVIGLATHLGGPLLRAETVMDLFAIAFFAPLTFLYARAYLRKDASDPTRSPAN